MNNKFLSTSHFNFDNLVMLKTIRSYFKVLTREQKEHNALVQQQETRLYAEQQQTASTEVINLIDERDIIEGNIGTTVINALEAILIDLEPETCNNHTIRVKRHENVKKPDNWRSIAQHFAINNNAKSTITKYELYQLHDDYDYWYQTLRRWKLKASKSDIPESLKGRMSVVGMIIEQELVEVIERYNHHGIPLTNNILRCRDAHW